MQNNDKDNSVVQNDNVQLSPNTIEDIPKAWGNFQRFQRKMQDRRIVD